jgi:hypothetical protein
MAKLLEVNTPQRVTDFIAPYQGNFATLEKNRLSDPPASFRHAAVAVDAAR